MAANTICLVTLAAVAAFAATAAWYHISAESLRTNINWLAADERQGRLTPSPGLEASADYIAGQFRQAGLSAGGDGGTFFQTAPFTQITQDLKEFRLRLEAGGRAVNVRGESVEADAITALDYQATPVVRLPQSGPLPVISGRIALGDESWAGEAALDILALQKPALIVLVLDGGPPGPTNPTLAEAGNPVPPVIRVYSRAAADLLSHRTEIKLTLHVSAPAREDVRLRNVAGILRGSDPAVRDRFVILSAHYDHLGVKSPGPGNRIYHGANDNASGVASLIEIGKALNFATHPRRSILFLAVFGEEEGLLGSGYYVRHPLIPLAHTVADMNLEQLGRTDSSDGPEIARFTISGPSYSNLAQMMEAGTRNAGVVLYRKENGDDYFDRSDNYSFAASGIVAHTLTVAFEFPDYHEVSDEAAKIDYGNLARVDRGIAAALSAIADAASVPRWSDTKATRPFRDAAVKQSR